MIDEAPKLFEDKPYQILKSGKGSFSKMSLTGVWDLSTNNNVICFSGCQSTLLEAIVTTTIAKPKILSFKS
jgi:hypothetical protein